MKDRLRALRMASGKTQVEVAKEIKVAPKTYLAWELGDNTPKAEYGQRLAKMFKVTLDYLYLGRTLTGSLKGLLNIDESEAELILKALDYLAGKDRKLYDEYVIVFRDLWWEMSRNT